MAAQRVGQVDAEFERSADDDYAKARMIEASAEATAADVRASGVRAQTLKPGDQVTGAIFFTYQKKRGESVLRLPIGDQVFEFRFPPKEKK